MNTTMTHVASIAILAVSASTAQAETLIAGTVLTISAGNFTTGINNGGTNNIAYNGGSFWGMDNNHDGKITSNEATALAQGATGIVIGASNTAQGDITSTWDFNGAPGTDFVSTAITGGTSGLNMSGWTMNWNSGDVVNGPAWQINPVNPSINNIMPVNAYADHTAVFNWDGIYGHGYTLDYTAILTNGSFQGFRYALHLEGIAGVVPEVSTYGMMLAGLGLVGFGVGRRKKQPRVGMSMK